MNINGQHYDTLWFKKDNVKIVQTIDQRFLPFEFKIVDLKSSKDVFYAIKEMIVRGAPLIGAAAGVGMYLAIINYSGKEEEADNYMDLQASYLISARPTAVNLPYAVIRQVNEIKKHKSLDEKKKAAFVIALKIIEEEKNYCKKIGEYGVELIKQISKRKQGDVVNILTHCNAGWLACIDYGTATSPIYSAYEKGIKIHVWVDETRPRNQGARLTAWELSQHGVPCTLIVDNTGGHLMQKGMVDMVIVGSDRTTINGDVANKIGTYLKALAAKDNNVPFYAALPSSTIDWQLEDGVNNIPIEQRDENEVKYIQAYTGNELTDVLITDKSVSAVNYGFDVTPARLVTGIITERGICKPNKKSILGLFPEKKQMHHD